MKNITTSIRRQHAFAALRELERGIIAWEHGRAEKIQIPALAADILRSIARGEL